MPTSDQLQTTPSALTTRQLRFVEEYCVDFNASRAARSAGYAEKSARVEGHRLLTNANIQQAVASRLHQLTMSSEEAAKRISDIAASRINDFMKVVTVKRPKSVQRPVLELIKELKAEMEFEDDYAALAELTEREQERHKEAQLERQRKIIRYQLMLDRNPEATVEAVDYEEVEEAQIDLVALAKAKDRGTIKTLSFNEHGPKIELYAADAALSKILEYYGKLKAAGETTNNVIIFQLPDNGR